MDQGRIHDIVMLQKVLDDPSESARHKRQATRSMRKIHATKNDKFIRKERERLMKALRANDTEESEKISDGLMNYTQRTFGFS